MSILPLAAGPEKSSVLLMRPTLERPKSVSCNLPQATIFRFTHASPTMICTDSNLRKYSSLEVRIYLLKKDEQYSWRENDMNFNFRSPPDKLAQLEINEQLPATFASPSRLTA